MNKKLYSFLSNNYVLITVLIFIIVSSILTTSVYWNDWIKWWHGIKLLFILSIGSCTGYLTLRIIAKKQGIETTMSRTTFIALILFSFLISPLCIELHAHKAQYIITAIGCMAFTCLLHSALGRFSIVFWIPFLFLELTQLVSHYRLGVRISSGVIAEILHASNAEIRSFATIGNLAGLGLVLFLAIILSYWQYRILKPYRKPGVAMYGFGILFSFYVLLAFTPNNVRLSPKHLQFLHIFPYPIQETYHIIRASSEEATQDLKLLMQIQTVGSPADAYSQSDIIPSDSGIVCILHIGESVLANRLGFNGYHRNTTPWLSSQKNLISYPRCISLYHQTTTAIIGILTDGARKEAQNQTYNLLSPGIGNVADLFAKHGFYTAMIAGYDAIYQKATVVRYTFGEAMLSINAKANCILESKGTPMQQANQVIELCQQLPQRNMFIILNNEGSHGPFAYYNHSAPTFTPSNHQELYSNPIPHKESINNAYDNTIVYTDQCIQAIAEGLKGRPFLYIYISDHGEYLGKDGVWGRTWIFAKEDPKEGIKAYRETDAALVGMFFLPSDEWLALHPHFRKASELLRQNQDLTVSHGHMFDTLLGIFGIKTEHYCPHMDCSSPLVKPYTGAQPGFSENQQLEECQ